MIKKIKVNWLLLLIFVFVLSFRLFFVFQVDGFSPDAYFNIKHIDYVSDNWHIMDHDWLSYGGRDVLLTPGFYYFIAFFDIFFSFDLLLKILPEILLASLVIIVYLISMEITQDKNSSLIAALISGFVPLLVEKTLNAVSVYSLVLPLMFFMFYCFIKLVEDRRYVVPFVVSSFILPLIHPSVLIFVFSLIFYFILLVSEGLRMNTLRKEVLLFSFFLILLIQFIIFKSAFIQYGLDIIKYNIPSKILEDYFRNVDVFSLVYAVGILPFVLGTIGVFYGIFSNKKRKIFLITSIILSVLLLLLTKLVEFYTGLIFLGVSLAILSAFTLSRLYRYIRLTKFSDYNSYLTYFILFLVTLFSIVPSFSVAKEVTENSLNSEELEALEWFRDSSGDREVVLADISEGHLINVVAERKTVMDDYFLLVDDAFMRYNDVNKVFTTGSEAVALGIVDKYNIRYFYISERVKERYNIESIKYLENRNCFDRLWNNEVQIYKIVC